VKENLITGDILKCVYKVHTNLGPGLLESAYQACLAFELKNAGFSIMTEKALPLIYEEVKLEAGYRIDILVNKLIVLEVKSTEALSEIHTAQMLTYLKLSGCRLGYLLNFNVKSMKNGIKRLIMT
jgi:GxxExxY protein